VPRSARDEALSLLEQRNQARAERGTVDRLLDAELRERMAVLFAPDRLTLRTLQPGDDAAVLDQVVEHDAVHPVQGPDDLLRRLADDRRILALEHEAIADRLLVFVEVALGHGLEADMPTILHGPVASSGGADTAVFYSINRCEPGLAGLHVPAELLRRAIPALEAEHPSLRVFSTLSPIPSLRRRVRESRPELAAELDRDWESPPDSVRQQLSDAAGELIGAVAGGRVPDPVARFHLANGARLVALRWGADPSPRGVERSWGLMANYQYAP
jgi:malonyl-CoA decarboxylase